MARVTAAPAPYRALRGSLVAFVGLAVAVAGHAAGGGEVSAGPLGAPAAALVLAACVVASSRAWTRARLVAALVGIQVVSHLSLLLVTPSGSVDPRLAGLATGGHAHVHTAALTPTMLAAHGVAVLVAALLLARIDVAAVLLWHLAGRLLGVVRAVPARVPAAVHVPVDSHVRPVRPLRTASSATRRGPPLGLARA